MLLQGIFTSDYIAALSGRVVACILVVAMDQPSSSSSTAKHPEQAEKSEKPFNPANVPPPVQGVPVATGPPGYYPEQQYYANRPVGYGSYATQGAPGVASNPYHPPVPTSFEVHEVRPQEPLPCLCGVQLVL